MLEWIGLLPLLGLTGNWRGYRMGGKAIGGANMPTDLKKKFEAARAAGKVDEANAMADRVQKFNDDKKAEKAKTTGTVADVTAKNFSDYATVPVLGTLTQRDKNRQDMQKIDVDLKQLRFLQGRTNASAQEKAKKLSQEIDKRLRRSGIRMGTQGIVPVGDRVVRAMSSAANEKAGTAEGIIQVPYGISSKGQPGFLSPRVSISNDKMNVDFSRSGTGVEQQGSRSARLEIESFLQDNKSSIKKLFAE
jgi:hypothetical protein